MASSVLFVFVSCPDSNTAEQLAKSLVDERCATCVNLIPEVASIYRWQGEVQQETEVMMICKTTRQAFPKLEEFIKAEHPYELPEIAAVGVDQGLPEFLKWVADGIESVIPGEKI